MTDEIREIRGVEICVEAFGSPRDPCVLLLMGAMASMLWWDEEFCKQLAGRGHFVVRFDHRDVGRSMGSPGAEPDYDVDEMVLDALGVLDSFGVSQAHFVGMSLGGMLAQIAALRFSERVSSITAIASGVFDDRPDLPTVDPSVLAYHQRAGDVDWTSESEVVGYLVGGWKLLAGSGRVFDEGRAHALAAHEFRRARLLANMFKHALLSGAEDLYGKSAQISVPLVVIHGTDDKVLPLPHAEALASAVSTSKLVVLEGVGHELHADDWGRIIEEIAALTDRPR